VWLLIVYAGLMVLGEGANYLIGLAIERMWGSQASLISFLALYFVVLWVAWIVAVKITEPRGVVRVAQG
jgi:hypothetical protein